MPHPLCRRAAEEVCAYLGEHSEWSAEIAQGKMFGVLVVRDGSGRVGYLAAFSGNLAGSNVHQGFVPPIYNMLQPDERFRCGEAEISAINRRVEELEQSEEFAQKRQRLAECISCGESAVNEAKQTLKEQKAARNAERAVTTNPDRLEILTRESQFQKAEFARLKKQWRDRVEQCRREVEAYQNEIEKLCIERKHRSEELQMWLFGQFRLLNARGEQRNLCDIFAPTPQRIPPAGAGECAAPKLLQYAYQNALQPIAMAEFWQGCSPRGEVRRAGEFYPSCQGKCGPILGFMLQGLDVEKRVVTTKLEPTLIYEDEWLAVVSKPTGMLSVEGRGEKWSVEQWARERFVQAERVMLVHRLDMATSGLLVIAKSLEAYRALQGEFKACRVEKRYVAMLEGVVTEEEGCVELPLATDYEHRPCQKVDFESGKRSVTEYRVLERREGRTLVEFRPLTGRTHQLRLHAAHLEGLAAPIVGDTLYGRRAERLFLHAESIAFRHPATEEWVTFESRCDF
ncbi:MAG: RNA pseudouridine synthase [Tidjanibacter sp.]|nr:RNA pseudouridine synthase [Tidjanibacter sp.]